MALVAHPMACSESEDGGAGDPIPAEGEGEGEGQLPPEDELPDLAWEVEVVQGDRAGQDADIQMGPDGNPVIIHFRPTGDEAPCVKSPFAKNLEAELVYSSRGPAGWSNEVVTVVDVRIGVSLRFDSSGVAHLAFPGGDQETANWCGGNDMMLMTRQGGAWGAQQDLQVESAVPGATCRKQQNVCNKGDVTGLWPALAFSPSGRQALVFQDVHFGFTKEDFDSSDVEIAMGPGWSVSSLWDSGGGGKMSAAVFDLGEDLGVAWYAEKGGIWFMREVDGAFPGDDAEPVLVDDVVTRYRLSMVALPEGGFALAYYAYDGGLKSGDLWYASSPDGADWRVEPVDQSAHTGMSPSLALDSRGRPVIAYARCNEVGEKECHRNRDAIRLARRRSDGGWKLETIDKAAGEETDEHDSVSLALDSDDMPWVAFRRSRFDASTGQTIGDLRVARARTR